MVEAVSQQATWNAPIQKSSYFVVETLVVPDLLVVL
jgi:hypothetical protein